MEQRVLSGSGRAVAVLLTGATLVCAAAQAQNAPAGATANTPPAATAPAAGKKAAAPAGKAEAAPNAKSAASYSIGLSMGAELRQANLSPDTVSVERIAAGIRDALSGKVKPGDKDRENITGLIRQVHDAAVEKNHAAAQAFLAENAKNKDVVTTASGLQYKVLSPGSGEPPKPTDEVTVNYRGTLLDGTEFDSSYKRGQPATFPANRVIPGWQEALLLMKPGSKYQLFIPPKLAYDVQSPPGIPPGSLLKFDVELISAKPQPAQPPQPAMPGAPGAPAAPKAPPASAPK